MMKTINKAKSAYVRQIGQDDCALACLAMVLNFQGNWKSGYQVMNEPVPPGGLSLLEMKALGCQYGLIARAVEMDLSTLKSLQSPCIVHLILENGSGHYSVCYGFKNGKFLLADPATQVHTWSAETLSKFWTSRSVLYLEELSQNHKKHSQYNWITLLSLSDIPFPFLVTIGLLSMITAASGIALTWYFQKVITDEALLEPSVVATVITLITLIGLFRALTNFVKQRFLVHISLQFNHNLMQAYLKKLVTTGENKFRERVNVKASLSDIQKIQNAVSSFVAVIVADGVIIVLMLCAITFFLPSIAVIDCVSIGLIMFLTFNKVIDGTHQHIVTTQMSTKFESHLSAFVTTEPPGSPASSQDMLPEFVSESKKVLNFARKVTLRSGKVICGIESIGVITLAVVLTLSLNAFGNGDCPLSEVIAAAAISYVIFNLLPKVCSALETISAGADAAIQFQRFLRS